MFPISVPLTQYEEAEILRSGRGGCRWGHWRGGAVSRAIDSMMRGGGTRRELSNTLLKAYREAKGDNGCYLAIGLWVSNEFK